METGVNWKFQVKTLELEPQENLRGIRQDPLQIIGDPSAVNKRTPSAEDDLGPGTQIQRLWSPQGILDPREYLSRTGG